MGPAGVLDWAAMEDSPVDRKTGGKLGLYNSPRDHKEVLVDNHAVEMVVGKMGTLVESPSPVEVPMALSH